MDSVTFKNTRQGVEQTFEVFTWSIEIGHKQWNFPDKVSVKCNFSINPATAMADWGTLGALLKIQDKQAVAMLKGIHTDYHSSEFEFDVLSWLKP